MYANEHVYHGELKGQHINSQLTWNDESLTALTDSLNGKRQNANIRFKEDEMILTLICEIRTGINVTIFDIEMQYLEGEVPFQHMKSLFMGFKNDYINE